MKRNIKIACIAICISIVIIEKVFAVKNYNQFDMYWKSYGDGTFAYASKEEPIDSTKKRGAWHQYPDGSWGFFMSIDGGYVFEPLKNCSAFINFVDNPIYNLFVFDENGKMIRGEYRNLDFPSSDSFYIDIYAYRVALRMQPSGVCINEGSVLNSRALGPFQYR